MNEIEVKVVKYPDRKNLVLRWIDPETGRKRTKSAKTTRKREAQRLAGKLEADLAAGKVAGAVLAEKLVMVSDTHGVRTVPEDPDSLAPSLTERQLRELIDRGVISAGMQPKVQACLEALDAGVGKAHIIDGRLSHSLLLEIYTDKGVGTEILK